MKSYLIKAISATVCYLVVHLILDAIFGEFYSVKEYAIQCIIFGVIIGLLMYLEERGIFNKKDKTEEK